ncbi:hypothetical protein [Brachybacterium epidermidis]|uniref:hypothetical protein n=1 Tax=Brachybacterium epidermidis TaxID=2781983 RepID=UPI00398F18B0
MNARSARGSARATAVVAMCGLLLAFAAGCGPLRSGGDDGPTAAEADEGATATGTEPSDPATSTPAPTTSEPPSPPSLDELRNSALMVPPGCAEYMYFDGEHGGTDPTAAPVQFVDGEAPGNAPSSSYTLGEEATALEVDGQALSIVVVHCFGGGSYTYPVIAAYDPDLHLAGWVDLLEDGYPQPGASPKPYLEDITVSGATLTYVHGGIELFGDEPCSACEKSGSATMTWQWTGEAFTSTDVVVHTPGGDVREPAIGDVQDVVDLLISGDDAAASYFVEGKVNPELVEGQTDFSTIGDGTLDFGRADVVPPGTQVQSCEVIGGGMFGENYGYGSWYQSYFMRDGSEIAYPSMVAGSSEPAYDTFPGDTVCLLRNDEDPPLGEFYNQSGFHLVLKGTEDGSVMVRVIGLGAFGAEI